MYSCICYLNNKSFIETLIIEKLPNEKKEDKQETAAKILELVCSISCIGKF